MEKSPDSGEREELPEAILDPTELTLLFDGAKVSLTRTQFSIFAYLVENRGGWVATGELIRHVLGTHHQPDTSLVRVHVHAIRRRLGWRAAWLESDPQRARGYRWRGRGR
jgi:DNA-binding response OmpR family regulator